MKTYSKQALTRYFMDWPSVMLSENLDVVVAKVDIINAVAAMEGIKHDEARRGILRAWLTVNGMGPLNLVAAATAFGEQVLPVINWGVHNG